MFGFLLILRKLRLLPRRTSYGLRVQILLNIAVLLFGCMVPYLLTMWLLDGMALDDVVWLFFTTITTTGFGDLYPKTWWGRGATICFIYIPGIAIFTNIIGNAAALAVEKREKRANGLWRWNLEDHIVILGVPNRNAEHFFDRFMRELRKAPGWETVDVQIMTPEWDTGNGFPAKLAQHDVAHYKGFPDSSADLLEGVNVLKARKIIIIAESQQSRSGDGHTFNIVSLLREIGVTCEIIVECIEDECRTRMRRAGATTVIRPLRAYPAMLVRAITDPGSEQIIEEIFTAGGDELVLIPVPIPPMPWRKVIEFCVLRDCGVPLGYRRLDGQIVTNPRASDMVAATALYVLVQDRSEADLSALLADMEPPGAVAS